MPESEATTNGTNGTQPPPFVHETEVDFEGQTEIHTDPKGRKLVPLSRFQAMNKAAKEAAKRAEEAMAKLAEVESKLATVTTQYQAELTRARLQGVLRAAGVTDADDLAEFEDRYSRVQPDEKGAKPDSATWAQGVVDAVRGGKGPKWAQGYVSAQKTEDVSATNGTAADKTKVTQGDPNHKVTQPATQPIRFTDEVVAKMTPEERRANMPAIRAELAAQGLMTAPKAQTKS